METALPLGPHDPADPMVLEVSVGDRNAVQSLSKDPIGKSQSKPSGFWSKALPSSADNEYPGEKTSHDDMRVTERRTVIINYH